MRFRQISGARSMNIATILPGTAGRRDPGGKPQRREERRFRRAHRAVRERVELSRHDGGDHPRRGARPGNDPRGDRHPRGVLPASHVRGRAGHAGYPDAGARRAGTAGVRRQEHAPLPDDHRAARRDGGSARARRQHDGRSAGAWGDAPPGDPRKASRGPGGFDGGGAEKGDGSPPPSPRTPVPVLGTDRLRKRDRDGHPPDGRAASGADADREESAGDHAAVRRRLPRSVALGERLRRRGSGR